jgi:hypothetical protein
LNEKFTPEQKHIFIATPSYIIHMKKKKKKKTPPLVQLDIEWPIPFYLQSASEYHVGRHMKYHFSSHPSK